MRRLARRGDRIGALAFGVALAALILANRGSAQIAVERPGDTRPELPEFEAEAEPSPLLPVPPPRRPERLPQAEVRIFVADYAFEGHTAFDEQALRRVTAPFSGRAISSAELRAARDAVTRLYVDAGYITSGAVIPDQPLEDGVVSIRIVEGRLTDVRLVEGGRYSAGYLRGRLAREAGRPLQLQRLEDAIHRLQREPDIARLDAELGPGLRPGEAVLKLRIESRLALSGRLQTDNFVPPSVGEYTGRLNVEYTNLTGRTDRLFASLIGSGGLIEVSGGYVAPFGPFDTRLTAHARYTRSRVVEAPFDELDIEVDAVTVGLGLEQPLLSTRRTELSTGLGFEWRRSETRAFGLPAFDFPGTGSVDGRSTVSALRWSMAWSHRRPRQAFAARSLLSVGLDALGATRAPDVPRDPLLGEAPDGRYVAWLGQLQWARRIGLTSRTAAIARMRLDVQLSSDPLLGFERFAIGGHATVRAHRENFLVADQGVIGSAELRVPLWSDARGRGVVFLTPAYDIGHAFNRNRPTPEPETIQSVSVTLGLEPRPWLTSELILGYAFHALDLDRSLQDQGVAFRVTASF